MAKQIVKKQSAVKRMFNWFRRHKIIGVFSSFVIVMALYLFGSWFVLQVQIHFERERFYKTQREISNLAYGIQTYVGNSFFYQIIPTCSYTNVEFSQGSRTCDVDAYSTEPARGITGAKDNIQRNNKYISTQYLNSISMGRTTNINNIANYNLNLGNGLSCFVDYWYFDNSTLPFNTDSFKTNIKEGLFTQINCSGGAKAEYFPVTQD